MDTKKHKLTPVDGPVTLASKSSSSIGDDRLRQLITMMEVERVDHHRMCTKKEYYCSLTDAAADLRIAHVLLCALLYPVHCTYCANVGGRERQRKRWSSY